MKHHHLAVSPATVHWGYFSKAVAPALAECSGDRVTIETLTHHAADDYEHIMTAPVAVAQVEPGDALEVHILDIRLSHKHRDLGGTVLEGLAHPMLESDQQMVRPWLHLHQLPCGTWPSIHKSIFD